MADDHTEWLSGIKSDKPDADDPRKLDRFDDAGELCDAVGTRDGSGNESIDSGFFRDSGQQPVCFSGDVADRIDRERIANARAVSWYAILSDSERQR